MLKRFRNNRGSFVEYATLFIVVTLGLVAMQTYMRRGFMGRWKSAGDAIGYGRQYDTGTQVNTFNYDAGSGTIPPELCEDIECGNHDTCDPLCYICGCSPCRTRKECLGIDLPPGPLRG